MPLVTRRQRAIDAQTMPLGDPSDPRGDPPLLTRAQRLRVLRRWSTWIALAGLCVMVVPLAGGTGSVTAPVVVTLGAAIAALAWTRVSMRRRARGTSLATAVLGLVALAIAPALARPAGPLTAALGTSVVVAGLLAARGARRRW